MSNMYSGPA